MAFKKQVKIEVPANETENTQENIQEITQQTSKPKTLASMRNEMEKAARKLRKVTVHYNDPRDSSMVTSAHVQASNPYFALGRIVPLDMSIELEQALCDNLAEALIQVHIPDPKNPGLMTSKMIKKYSVIYED